MGRTVNRVPYNVNIPNKNDIREYVFNHSVWKGLTDDKNFITVDQETFEDAKNVYADKHNLLKSRPSLKPLPIVINGENITNIDYIWNVDIGTIYSYGDERMLVKNDETIVDLSQFSSSKESYVSLRNDVIIFSDGVSIYHTHDGTYETGEDALYIPKEVDNRKERDNAFTSSKRIVHTVDDTAIIDGTALGYVYDVIYNGEILSTLSLFNIADLRNVFVDFGKRTIIDVKIDSSKNDAILYKSDNKYYVLYHGGVVNIDTNEFEPLGISNDGRYVYGASSGISDEKLVLTFKYYDLKTKMYNSKNWTANLPVSNWEISESLTLMENNVEFAVIYDKLILYVKDDTLYQLTVNAIDGEEEGLKTSCLLDAFHANKFYLTGGMLFSIRAERYATMNTGNGQNIEFFRYDLYRYDIKNNALSSTKIASLGKIFAVVPDEGDAYVTERSNYYNDNVILNDNVLTVTLIESFSDSIATNELNGPYNLFIREYNVDLIDKTVTKHILAINEGIKNYNYGTFNKYFRSRYVGNTHYLSYDIGNNQSTTITENSYTFLSKDELENAEYFIGNYLYKNVGDRCETNNLVLTGDIVELQRTVEGTTNIVEPDIIKTFGNKIVIAADDTLYVSEYVEEFGKFKLYFPNKTEFANKITNIQYINDNQFAVFFENEIYYITSAVDNDGSTYYTYEKSKLDIGCTEGSDVITSFDGSYSIFTSKRGLAYLSYQQFVASTDQTATFISDSINERFKKFNDGPVKLEKNEYWIYVYKPDSNELYLLDNRNGSWWYWTTPDSLTSIVITNEPKLLINGSLYTFDYTDENYYDSVNDEDSNVEWYVKSQKLHLNAVNNYKSITSFNLSTLSDSEDTVSMNLECMTYRDIFDKHKKEVLEYYVDSVKSFSKRLSYHKVMEFQYKLSYDDYSYQQLPLSLSNISVRYKIGGAIR